jgi:AcrR family transcriptional regulator
MRQVQARGEETQRRLLDATIDCILERGYNDTSTRDISERAGISRGAQQHHFPRKTDLVSEAIRRLAERRLAELIERAEQVAAGPQRIPAAIDLFWESLQSDLFVVAIQVWMAARDDRELRLALAESEQHIATAVRDSAARMFGPDIASHPSFRDDVQLAFNTMRGVTLLQILQSEDHAHEHQWASARAHLIEHFSSRRSARAVRA